MRDTTQAPNSANGVLSGTSPLFHHYEALQQKGYEESKKVNGEASLLENFLGALCDYDRTSSDLRREIFKADEHGHALHQQLKNEGEHVKSLQIEAKQEESRGTVAIKQREEDIFDKQIEIKRIKNGDYTLVGNDANPANRLAFYICMTILIALSVYLILFYVSVIYNAFILDVGRAAAALADENQGFSSMTIVNLQAIPEVSYEHGILGTLFLLSASFMFLGLGFLIHWLTHRRSWYWLAGIYLFTLIFDGFLAYEIVQKIHESQVMIGLVEADVRGGLSMALADSVFWIIIFAGFSMYVVWGLLLRYLLDEYYKIIPARVAIRHRKAQIKKMRDEITGIKQEMNTRINTLRQETAKIEQQHIGKLRTDLERNDKTLRDLRAKLTETLVQNGFSYQDMQNRIVPFFTGWCQYLTERYEENAGPKVELCQATLNGFYKKIGMN